MKRYLILLLTCTILLTSSLPVLAVNNVIQTEEFTCYFDDDCYVEESILYYANSLVVTKKITLKGPLLQAEPLNICKPAMALLIAVLYP